MVDTERFIVVDSVFPRYVVVVNIFEQTTSVWCQECQEWVAEWDSEKLSRNKPPEFLEKIIAKHADDFGDTVKFK